MPQAAKIAVIMHRRGRAIIGWLLAIPARCPETQRVLGQRADRV
jgi:hypothetical protein